MVQTPSKKRKLDSNWLTAGKECGSVLRSCLWGGALHDNTKSGCVADYNHSSPSIIFFIQGPIYSSAEFMHEKKNSNLFGDCYFTLIKRSQINICKCFTLVKFIHKLFVFPFYKNTCLATYLWQICLLQGPMGWIQRQMTLGINPEDILAYMLPHTQLVRQD